MKHFICCVMLVLSASAALADESGFTAPVTAPEKALASLLKWHMEQFEERGSNHFEFLVQRPGRKKDKDRLYYSKYTRGLIKAISGVNRKMSGPGLSGIDYDPILCAQDILLPPHYYMTTRMETAAHRVAPSPEEAASAFVLFRSGDGKDAHRVDYLLEKEGGIWKIAGVACGKTMFNIR